MASPNIILLVDPDPHTRALIAAQLKETGCHIMQAEDGPAALRIAAEIPVSILMTELYLSTGDDACLVHAVRRDKAYRKTRIVAHTHRNLPADREWAMRAGADAYLIKPTRAQRVRYVVSRLMNTRVPSVQVPATSSGPMARRESLDAALSEMEQGVTDTSTIVFGRAWWEQLSPAQRKAYRARAKRAGVNLRSDSMLGNHFVEVRGSSRDGVGLSTERPESPYRR